MSHRPLPALLVGEIRAPGCGKTCSIVTCTIDRINLISEELVIVFPHCDLGDNGLVPVVRRAGK